MSVAQEIKNQLGNKTLVMLGAYQFVGDSSSLKFRIKGSRKINLILIYYDKSMDLYNIEFWKISGIKANLISSKEGVYATDMHQVIEAETGLRTSLN